MAHILIVEDEASISDLISMNLSLVGHRCEVMEDGSEASEAVFGRYDLVILDVMLPGMSGFELIGLTGKTPVIFVTAKSGLDDRLRGLRLGADDYIVKPFEILELVARVDAVLRRTNALPNGFAFDDLRVEFDSKRVYKAGREVALKPKEYELLEALIRNRNLALSRERLLDIVWDYDYVGDSRTVDVHVQKLRKKLGLEERLKTVYKTGYRLEVTK